jgi:cytochrome c5
MKKWLIISLATIFLVACSKHSGKPMYGLVQEEPEKLNYKQQLELGKKIYDRRCSVCHATGSGGAPKITNDAQWSVRSKKPLKLLIEHVTQGYKLMPAKGECFKCSPQEIESAIKFMLSLHGVKA